MKRMLSIVALAFLCAVLLLGVTPRDALAQGKAVTMNFANFFPAESKITHLMNDWCKDVDKRTSGRVKVTQFPGGTLSPPGQTYSAVVKGVADIGLSFTGYTAGRFPLTDGIEQPLGYKSGLVGTKMANAYFKKFKPKEFDEVKVLFLHTSPPHLLFAKKPINKLDDLKGLKIRSSGPSALIVKALGGVAVAMPMSDAYDSLSKGVVQGIICPYEPMKGFNLAEVVSYAMEHGTAHVGSAYVVMNKDKWNSLPPDVQKTIDQIDEEYIEKLGKLWDEYDAEGKETFLKKGGKIVVVSKAENARWDEKLRPILDQYVKDMKAKNLPGEEALNFFKDYLKKNQK